MDTHYLAKDIEAIDKAVTFEELCQIALVILSRLGSGVGMVCGPISTGGTGSKEKNIEIFAKHIEMLRIQGCKIFSQLPFEKVMWRIMKTPYYNNGYQLLDKFYLPIFESGLVETLYFIPGWKGSLGTTWEHEQAKRLGLQIIYLDIK